MKLDKKDLKIRRKEPTQNTYSQKNWTEPAYPKTMRLLTEILETNENVGDTGDEESQEEWVTKPKDQEK